MTGLENDMSAVDDLTDLNRLLGRDLVAELDELERARERLRAFDEASRDVGPSGRTFVEERSGRLEVRAGELVASERRRELEARCLEAERAVAVLLVELRQRLDREAREEGPVRG